MRTVVNAIVIYIGILLMSCNSSDQQAIDISEYKQASINFVNSWNDSLSTDYSIISSDIFIQHNLNIGEGKQEYIDYLEIRKYEGLSVEIVRSLQDSQYVFIQSIQSTKSPTTLQVVYDVFRYYQGRIVEHWENREDIQPNNVSGNSQTNGATKIKDLHLTEQNKLIVKEYLTMLLIEKDMDNVDRFFNGNMYIQHNPHVADGVSSIKSVIQTFEKDGVNIGYDTIHQIIGEGNFVLAMSEGILGKDQISYFDLLRVENGKIVEHWDAIETIPFYKSWKNSNGKFEVKYR